MANKPIKTAPHHSPGGKQIKTPVGYQYTSTRMEKRKTRKYQVLVRRQSNQSFHHCLRKCKMVQPAQRVVWYFLRKRNLHSPSNSAVLLLGIYRSEMTTSHKNLYTDVYRGLIITPNRKNPNVIRLVNAPKTAFYFRTHRNTTQR